MNDEQKKAVIEAILFTMGESVPVNKISEILEIDKKETERLLDELMQYYESDSRGMKIIELDGSYQMCTKSEHYDYLIKLAKSQRKYVLSESVLETLSIIAYKQPVTKVEIDRIRGVSCDFAINKLLEYNLVKELGRLDAPGRPILFGTSEEFLRTFGVRSLSDLPELSTTQIEDFRLQAEEEVQLKLEI